MKIFFIGLFFCVATYVACGQNDVTLVVSGEGKDKEEATLNALRSAVEQTFGTFVSANTKILDDKIVSDEVVSLSSGNIKRYEYISVEKLPNGNTFATLSAEIAINKLVAFAKSKGSECEFAGATFGANVKVYKLYVESSKKVLNNLRLQCIELAPFLYDYELEVGEPQMDGTVEFTVRVLANENTRSFGELIKSTLEALEIDSIYANQLKNMGIETYVVSVFTGKREKREERSDYGTIIYYNDKCKYKVSGSRHYDIKDLHDDEVKNKYLCSNVYESKEDHWFYLLNRGRAFPKFYQEKHENIESCCWLISNLMLLSFHNFIVKDNFDHVYTPNGLLNLGAGIHSWFENDYSVFYNVHSADYYYETREDRYAFADMGFDIEDIFIVEDASTFFYKNKLKIIVINTDYDKGDECFQVKFKEKIPIESLSQISKFTVERKSDKF